MLLHPVPVTNFSFSFGMLTFALLTESTTLALAYKHLRANAKAEGQNIFTYISRSNDPAVNVIFCEDAAAVFGIFIAGGTMALTSVTGSPLWDAFGSIGVGTLLALVSGYIVNTNARVLLGWFVKLINLRFHRYRRRMYSTLLGHALIFFSRHAKSQVVQ